MQIEDYVKAGKIASEVRELVRAKNWVGKTVYEICEEVEGEIRNRGAKCAFPVNTSINEVAAHYTAEPNDPITITDTVTFAYNGGSQEQHVTQALNSSITYPQLSVLIPTVPSGALGEAISRDIKIFNAQSCISSFEWMEIMDSDVSIDSH